MAVGSDVRITEEVVSPDGSTTVLSEERVYRPAVGTVDDGVVGPASESLDLRLGANQDGVPAAFNDIIRRQLQQMHADLRLPDSAPYDLVRTQYLSRAIRRVEQGAGISAAMRNVPKSLTGLAPGDFHSFRTSLISGLTSSATEGVNRSRAQRGDREPKGAERTTLAMLEFWSTAMPYFLPTPTPSPRGLPDPPRNLPGPAIAIFHDLMQIPTDPDLKVLGWLFFAGPCGRPEPVMSVVLATPGTGCTDPKIDIVNASTTSGALAATAGKILDLVAGGTWEVSKRRKIPGPMGSKQWRDGLGRTKELHTGSLAQVHTLVE